MEKIRNFGNKILGAVSKTVSHSDRLLRLLSQQVVKQRTLILTQKDIDNLPAGYTYSGDTIMYKICPNQVTLANMMGLSLNSYDVHTMNVTGDYTKLSRTDWIDLLDTLSTVIGRLHQNYYTHNNVTYDNIVLCDKQFKLYQFENINGPIDRVDMDKEAEYDVNCARNVLTFTAPKDDDIQTFVKRIQANNKISEWYSNWASLPKQSVIEQAPVQSLRPLPPHQGNVINPPPLPNSVMRMNYQRVRQQTQRIENVVRVTTNSGNTHAYSIIKVEKNTPVRPPAVKACIDTEPSTCYSVSTMPSRAGGAARHNKTHVLIKGRKRPSKVHIDHAGKRFVKLNGYVVHLADIRGKYRYIV